MPALESGCRQVQVSASQRPHPNMESQDCRARPHGSSGVTVPGRISVPTPVGHAFLRAEARPPRLSPPTLPQLQQSNENPSSKDHPVCTRPGGSVVPSSSSTPPANSASASDFTHILTSLKRPRLATRSPFLKGTSES